MNGERRTERAREIKQAICDAAEFMLENSMTHAQKNGIAAFIAHECGLLSDQIDIIEEYGVKAHLITTGTAANPGDPDFPF